MRAAHTSRELRFVAFMLFGLAILHLNVAPALAQRGSRTIMRGNADGTHEVLMLTAPNYVALRTPDFTPRDLALFTTILVLSEEQTEVMRQQIGHYLETFRALTKEFAAATEDPEAEYIPEDLKKTLESDDKPDSATDMNLAQFNLPPNVSVSIGMSTSRSRPEDPNGPAPPPEVKVSVTLDAPEGEEIPQETIDKIRERANVVAANIVQRMLDEEAAREAGQPPPNPVFEADNSFDVLKAKHDELLKKVDEFVKSKGKLRENFVFEAHSILSDEQVARWAALERALYRQRSLPKGELPGESVDLIHIIDSLDLSESQREDIGPDLESFELALDAALRHRDAQLENSTAKIDEAIANQKFDLALTLTDRVTSSRLALRSINSNYMELFAQSVGAEAGESLRSAALKQCYPRAFSATRGQKMFDQIRKLTDLDEQTREAIASLQASYESELASINQQLRIMYDREAGEGARRNIEHLKDSFEGVPSRAMEYKDPIRPLLNKRADLDDHYLKLVTEVVGPQRAAALPKARKNREPIRIESDSSSS